MTLLKNKLKLNCNHDDYLVILLTLSPSLTNEQITQLFKNKYNYELTERQLKDALLRIKDRLNVQSEELTYELACKIGLINYESKTARLILLDDLITKCYKGEITQINTARGEVVEIEKKDYKIALDALKMYKEELATHKKEDEYTYIVQIGDLELPPREPYQEGDEDL